MESRKSFLIKRAIALVMFGLVVVQVGPSLADVLNPNPDPTPTASAAPEVSVTPTADPSPSDSPSASPSASPQPSGSYTYLSASESPTPEPTLASIQDVILRSPSTFPVDPRATSVRISPINVYSAGDVLVCMSTSGSHFWLANQGSNVLTSGNGTRSLILSGPANEVNIVLNSGQGLRVGGNPKIQGTSVFSRAVSVTRPTLNTDLCRGATVATNSNIVALGLGMNTVKNPVPIK